MLKRSVRRMAVWAGMLSALMLLLTCSTSRDAEPPNVILIVIDALRAGNLGCYGHFRDTSPNIDAIAERGTLFEDAITQAPWTKASFASFLTSLYPFQNGVTDWTSVLPDSIETLADKLGREGYDTICLVNMTAMAGRFKVLKGFAAISEAERSERAALRTTDDAIEMLAGAQEPFFMLLHYFDPHAPYAPPIEYADLVRRPSDPDPVAAKRRGWRDAAGNPSEEAINRRLLLYDGCIRFVDDNVGRLLAFLEERGLRGRTLIVITADHGEEFYEHGVSGHGITVYDYAIRVPLIIDYPGAFEGGRRISSQVRLVDIMPTVLDIAGIDCGDAVEGYSLVDVAGKNRWPEQGHRLLPPQVALSECSVRRTLGTKCLRTDATKVIIEPMTSLIEVYDLTEDPDEEVNIWKSRRGAGEELVTRLKDVPGISPGGWRVAFTGKEDSAKVRIKASVIGQGHITGIEVMTRAGDIAPRTDPDSTVLMIETRLNCLQLVIFDTHPEDAGLKVEFEGSGGPLPETVKVGMSAEHRFGRQAALERQDALGLPQDFSESREKETAGVYMWWLPGDRRAGAAMEEDLTPEENRRLRALGYLQ